MRLKCSTDCMLFPPYFSTTSWMFLNPAFYNTFLMNSKAEKITPKQKKTQVMQKTTESVEGRDRENCRRTREANDFSMQLLWAFAGVETLESRTVRLFIDFFIKGLESRISSGFEACFFIFTLSTLFPYKRYTISTSSVFFFQGQQSYLARNTLRS